MTVITESLIRKRAEHNDGILATLEELSLHQSNIEKIELLGHFCKHLRILYLQSNLISKLQNLHKLKELEYLNLAVNNLTKVQNLQRCESLQKLDLTVNFLDKAGLISLVSLQHNVLLTELYLIGNPCVEWQGYRQFVVGTLPQLKKLDGTAVTPSERIAARQVLPALQQQLNSELIASGIDPESAAKVEDDGKEDVDIAETGYRDENGDMRRPWCPATRILEHRETQAQEQEAECKRREQQQSRVTLEDPKPALRESFPEIKDGEEVRQKNEGKWDFTLQDSEDGSAVELDVAVGRYMDSSLINADVQPSYVRLLIKGHLLQLRLPSEIRPDSSKAERSKATGHLLLTMPKEEPLAKSCNPAFTRPGSGISATSSLLPMPIKIQSITNRSQVEQSRHNTDRIVPQAATHCLHDDSDDDFLPEL